MPQPKNMAKNTGSRAFKRVKHIQRGKTTNNIDDRSQFKNKH